MMRMRMRIKEDQEGAMGPGDWPQIVAAGGACGLTELGPLIHREAGS